MPIKIAFLVILFMQTSANVQWKMKENMIVLGQPLNLECTTNSTNIQKVSRRWTGGLANRLLCFNGVATNPSKYKEYEDNLNKYTLQIKNTTEDDLDCPYSCRFGFQSDEKILHVTEDNFQYLPNKNGNEIEYTYGLEKDNYTVHFEFKKVFPEPVCVIQLKDTLYNLTKIKETKGRIFYHILYQLDSRDPLHDCGNDLEINCTIGSKSLMFIIQHNLTCTDLLSLEGTKSLIANMGILVSLLVVTATICTVLVIVYAIHKKRADLSDKGYKKAKTNVSSNMHSTCKQTICPIFCLTYQTTSDLGAVGRL